MNNEPVALTQGDILGILQDAESVPLGQPIFNSSEEYNKLKAIIESAIRYTHPVKDREKDRLRFSDEAFNRWLDEGISDSGHTVYDLVENVCEAWHGWENSQYYTHPVKELTDEEINRLWAESHEDGIAMQQGFTTQQHYFAHLILKKAQDGHKN